MLASMPTGDQQAWVWVPARAGLPVFKGLPQVEAMLLGRDRATLRLKQTNSTAKQDEAYSADLDKVV